MPQMESTRDLKVAKGEYDFAVDGGAISTIILGGFIEVDTILASGGAATVAVNSEAAGDLLAAAAFGGVPWSTINRKSITPAFTGATSVKTTVRRQLAITIAAAALTGGKFRVVVFYV